MCGWDTQTVADLAAGSEDGLAKFHLGQLLLNLLERGVEEGRMDYHTLDVPYTHTYRQLEKKTETSVQRSTLYIYYLQYMQGCPLKVSTMVYTLHLQKGFDKRHKGRYRVIINSYQKHTQP